MVEFELDGKIVSSNAGANILEVALKEGKYIPHFCYHKKLSIAANCRMCLVEVEKSAKPLPACATPVTEGMKVHTCSKMATQAQQGVMEFLLINHPLDCPVCDQGGECQLQDLAVGYGQSKSRFTEAKRAVSNKDLGSLVATNMTRCIHCSRCVRFTDEIAGYQELGMSYRNNQVEVMPFIGKTVNSELSGNIIDLCPVGALTSLPFRNSARNWELSRRKSVSPHDALGSNLILQVDKYHKVVRVLPFDNEETNECWLSDRDRFSYEGLYHEERLSEPMIKQDGKWHKVDWQVALEYVANTVNDIKQEHTANAIGVLANSNSTCEEFYLLQKIMQSIGVSNFDYRCGQSDFALDEYLQGANYLGSTLAEFVNTGNIVVIGSMLRYEQPLLLAKLRQKIRLGANLSLINVYQEDVLTKTQQQVTLDPRHIASFMEEVLAAIKDSIQNANNSTCDLQDIIISSAAREMAVNLLAANGDCHIVLGKIAQELPNYATVYRLAYAISKLIGARFGVLAASANEVGATLVLNLLVNNYNKEQANHTNTFTSTNACDLIANPRQCYILFNNELEHDSNNSHLALTALKQAKSVIVFNPFVNNRMLDYADVILPITPFSETAGTFVNLAGVLQSFNPATKALYQSKPAWRVLRVLANLFNVPNCDYNSIEDVRNEFLPQLLSALANNGLSNDLNNDLHSELHSSDLTTKANMANAQHNKRANEVNTNHNDDTLMRIGISAIYAGDSITRRAYSLQQTNLAKTPALQISTPLAQLLQIADKEPVRVFHSENNKDFSELGILNVAINDAIPPTSVLLLASVEASCGFAGKFGQIKLSKIS